MTGKIIAAVLILVVAAMFVMKLTHTSDTLEGVTAAQMSELESQAETTYTALDGAADRLQQAIERSALHPADLSRQCPIALDKIPAHVIKVHPVGDLSGRGRDMLGRRREAVKEALHMAASPPAKLFIREGSSLFEKSSKEIRRMVPNQGYAYWVAASSYTAPKLYKEKLVPGSVEGTFVVYSFKHGKIVCGAPVAAQSSASVQFSMRSGVDGNSTKARERYLKVAADKLHRDLAQNIIQTLRMEGALSLDPNAKSSVL